ncbi:MAG: HEAT repeat domain-containing protein [Phycisphaerales bacterium]
MLHGRHILPAAALAALAGCEQMSSDFSDASNSIFPPSPAAAGRWAVDDSDPENQRRGVLLLGNSTFGGDPVYINLYRLYIDENSDPVVKATAIQALARHGQPEDAVLIAKQLDSPVEQIRIAAARGLQRIHNPAIADQVWKKLIREEESASVRVELAIALGQYATRDSFEALTAALDDRELAVNLAAADSLRLITGADFGLESARWRAWLDATPTALRADVPYYYPTFERTLGFGDYIVFWAIPTWEQPGLPAGMRADATAPASATPPAATPAAAASPAATPAPATPPAK